ncbi:MAG: phosphoribosylglycinamide formyltransferase [Ignavibacteriales bacterium]|nr:phosphoribosylglycinamide formyltransferase [Ignavibacteriales bacterium]
MNLAVFASGRGSNLGAILEAIRKGDLPARLSVVISNNASAGALELARSNHIPAVRIRQQEYPSEEAFSEALISLLAQHEVDFIALAGYMRMIPPDVIARFRNRITNIHPALLPSFGGSGMYGMRVHEAVIRSGVKISGVTVHLVDEEYDHGPIVMQRAIEVTANDDPVSLAAKVQKLEHEMYPQALRAFAEGRVMMKGTTVWIR